MGTLGISVPKVEIWDAEQGRALLSMADRYEVKLRLFLSTFDNPRPDVEVPAIDFVSELTPAAPFLVAMTVEP